MILDFPNSPSLNQEYTHPQTGTVYVWNGSQWLLKFSATGATQVPPASTSIPGIIQIASNGDVNTGTNTTKAVTPAQLHDALATVTGVNDATDTVKGIVELATPGEAVAGTDTTRAITAEGLAARTPDSSTSVKGLVQLQDSLANGVVDKAPTVNSVFDALALKADVTAVDAALNTKANDNAVVHLSGDQSIGGHKTFTGTTDVPDPVGPSLIQAANIGYVQNLIAGITFPPIQVLHMTYEAAAGAGNLPTTGANDTWNKRYLNTVVENTIPGAAVINVFDGTFNLPVGKYLVKLKACNNQLTRARIALKQTTGLQPIVVPSLASGSDSGDNIVLSHEAILEITGSTKQYEMVHFWHARGASDNQGIDSDSVEPNIFAEVFIQKIG